MWDVLSMLFMYVLVTTENTFMVPLQCNFRTFHTFTFVTDFASTLWVKFPNIM